MESGQGHHDTVVPLPDDGTMARGPRMSLQASAPEAKGCISSSVGCGLGLGLVYII